MAEQQPLQQMPIFSKSYDMLVWLLQVTQHFPRANRHDYTKRLLDAAFDFRECLEIANLRRRNNTNRRTLCTNYKPQ